MILTKKATMTWASAYDQTGIQGLDDARTAYIQQEIAAGTTDGVPETVSPTITIRRWVDQTAAENWQSWIETAAITWGATLISVVIEDN